MSLKRRGLRYGPRLCIGDGNLGFWAAVREVFPSSKEQRCWVHSVPRRVQTNEVKRPHAGNTFKPASLGQMVEA
jgi:transposase-like protein